MSQKWDKKSTEKFVNTFIPLFVGVGATCFHIDSLGDMLEGTERGEILVFAMLFVGPVLAAVLYMAYLFAPRIKIGEVGGNLVVGLEIGIGLIGLAVLWEWYSDPANPHLEPLFVAVGVSFAVLAAIRLSMRRLAELPLPSIATRTGGDHETQSR